MPSSKGPAGTGHTQRGLHSGSHLDSFDRHRRLPRHRPGPLRPGSGARTRLPTGASPTAPRPHPGIVGARAPVGPPALRGHQRHPAHGGRGRRPHPPLRPGRPQHPPGGPAHGREPGRHRPPPRPPRPDRGLPPGLGIGAGQRDHPPRLPGQPYGRRSGDRRRRRRRLRGLRGSGLPEPARAGDKQLRQGDGRRPGADGHGRQRLRPPGLGVGDVHPPAVPPPLPGRRRPPPLADLGPQRPGPLRHRRPDGRGHPPPPVPAGGPHGQGRGQGAPRSSAPPAPSASGTTAPTTSGSRSCACSSAGPSGARSGE